MHGDPYLRSAHRASPAGGFALLTGQALVRQAQAGQARARQAVVRQALARRNRQPTGATGPDRPPAAPGGPGRLPAAHGGPAPLPGTHGRPDPLLRAHDGPDRRSMVGQQTSDRLAELWQAAAAQIAGLTPDRGTPEQAILREHQQPTAAQRSAAAARQRQARRRAAREPQQTPQTLLRGLGALIVMAIVGLSVFFIVAEERRGDGRQSAAPPGSTAGITSREVDSEPLTQLEVFPEPAVQPATGAARYPVTMTHSDSVCRTATTGELGELLEDYGCDQVVRARLTAPYGGYLVTTGVFNLADEAGAGRVSELAGALVENGRGSFATLGGSLGDPLIEPLAQVSWHNRGHFLLYCVVARPGGQVVTDDDPYAARITTELVQEYLAGQVVGRRVLNP